MPFTNHLLGEYPAYAIRAEEDYGGPNVSLLRLQVTLSAGADRFSAAASERAARVGVFNEPASDIRQSRLQGSGKLAGKIAIITGGDSGIGRAVAIGFAKEGADVAIVYLYEREDAEATKRMVAGYGRNCLLIEGDLRVPALSAEAVRRTLECYGSLDVIVLNQGVQFPQESILNITDEQLENTYRTNIFLTSI